MCGYRDGYCVGMIFDPKKFACPCCKKVKNKPYFYCELNDYKEFIPTCNQYLCKKSLSVSNLNFSTIDELIKIIGIEEYCKLIETDHGDDFDWSKSEVRTH